MMNDDVRSVDGLLMNVLQVICLMDARLMLCIVVGILWLV